jgi:molybdenum cofactor cytidylyltransferase
VTRGIAAVVLAAGLSSRLAPANKLLAALPGGALIAHTVRQVLASRAAPVIVVTGFQAARVGDALAGLAIQLVHAPDFADGIAASLRAGVAALPAETTAMLVVLGDMPLVGPTLINQMLAAYDPESSRDIVVPVWQASRGNPRLWGRRHFAALRGLSGDAGANRLLQLYPDRVLEIAAADDAVLRDFDTAAALETLR